MTGRVTFVSKLPHEYYQVVDVEGKKASYVALDVEGAL
jgi:hypothetical protein